MRTFLGLMAFASVTAQISPAAGLDAIPAKTVPPWQLWGPYRPNLYFGIRPQVPETLLVGLMWASGEDRTHMLNTLRDTCEQDEGIKGYGWTAYDTRVGGSQTIHDEELQIDLTTDFVKSEDGDPWAFAVIGKPRPGAPESVKTTLTFHVAVEQVDSDDDKSLVCGNEPEPEINSTTALGICRGTIPALGSYELRIEAESWNKPLTGNIINSQQVKEKMIWQPKGKPIPHMPKTQDTVTKMTKAVLKEHMKPQRRSESDSPTLESGPGAGNMHFLQMVFEGPFTATMAYRKLDAVTRPSYKYVHKLEALKNNFSAQVDTVFSRADPYGEDKYANFSNSMISNLLGGLGFFYGDSKADISHAPEYEETDLNFWEKAQAAMSGANITTMKPKSLLSLVPSRPFFPRGFLWDEGFHLLPVIEWDLDLAVSVLRSWLDLMDADGWIAREQILGPEARSKVPKQFQVQYPHYANPPTLVILVPILLSKLTGASRYAGHPSTYMASEDATKDLLQELYPLLARHYHWFRSTQAGDLSDTYPRPEAAVMNLGDEAGEGYRWRGRTPKHSLTSGLDDYPRADPPHPGELHVDALAWVGASAHALQELAEYLGEQDDAVTYGGHLKAAKHNLDALHWSSEDGMYCDSTIMGGEYTHVCHKGYLSLFPLLLGLIGTEHPSLPAVLDLLSDPAELRSPYGLRSLSASDPGYGKDEDYWRGAIWMNLNVLAVLRLRDLGLQELAAGAWPQAGSIQHRALKLARDLRKSIVDTVYNSWEETGFFWEQYSDHDGKGRRSRAFTGWTATVILLLGLEFDGSDLDGSTSEEGSFLTSTSAIAVFVLSLITIVGMLGRKQIIGLVVSLKEPWKKLRTMAGRSNGGGYEPLEVIDLDERRS